MKDQLTKKVRKVCERVGTSAALAKADEYAKAMEAEYDRRVASGMAELDAYKEFLGDLDKMEDLLRTLPETEEEAAAKGEAIARKEWNKKLSAIQGKINGIWWLLTVIFYLWFSFTFGRWHLTWLMFLSSSIGSILIDMLFDYNRGVPKKKVYGKLHEIFWLAVVIAYFLISFTFGKWHLTWLIFVLGVVVEGIVDLVKKIMD